MRKSRVITAAIMLLATTATTYARNQSPVLAAQSPMPTHTKTCVIPDNNGMWKVGGKLAKIVINEGPGGPVAEYSSQFFAYKDKPWTKSKPFQVPPVGGTTEFDTPDGYKIGVRVVSPDEMTLQIIAAFDLRAKFNCSEQPAAIPPPTK